MKAQTLLLNLLFLISFDSIATCQNPTGFFKPKEGFTNIEIGINNELEIFKSIKNRSVSIYKGSFINLGEEQDKESLNYDGVIVVKPLNKKQSHLMLNVSDECNFIKVGINRRLLERFGGKPPSLDSKWYFKND